ncbi:hypothetical protein LTR78_002771 [Recurvomyces mirabilis]|uniref:Uncharacterized protein n=1 Tax=Recurvomyces mirabilis TaxID=574656 RepID=A0AAE0WSJ8_9PEZI|nr:hypothetical protein LTR78_002771 [Recurvomyces mirabilis]KAK5159495.1 hypothetical protein LTS14_002637 [Recurvomyces mirabilis]
MGLAATVAAGGGPQAIDMGALFGLGARPPIQPEKSWSWEPPRVQSRREQVQPARVASSFGMSLEQSMVGVGFPLPPPPPSSALSWLPKMSTAKLPPAQIPDESQKAIRASKVEFDSLLHSLGNNDRIDREAIQRPITFLQSSEDEPLAQNLVTLCDWMATKEVSDEVIMLLISCVQDKVRLRTIASKQLAPVFDYLVRHAQNLSFESNLVGLLDTMVSVSGETSIRQLARSLEQLHGAKQADDDSIRFWFNILDSCEMMQGRRAPRVAWEQFYRLFAPKFQPAQLSEHLCKLQDEDLAEVILRYWVPKYIHAPVAEIQEPLTYRTSIRVNLHTLDRAKAGVVTAAMREDFTERRSKIRLARRYLERHTPLTTLFEILSERDISYSTLMLDLTNMFVEQNCSNKLYSLFRGVERSLQLGIPVSTADRIIEYLQTCGKDIDLARAFRVFEATPSVSLLACGDLPLTLIHRGLGTPDRIFLMLNRQHGPDITQEEFRTVRKLCLSQRHLKVVHFSAYHWAESRHKSARVALRRVWECYRFLQDRGADISVLVSRALVKAGILRPLQEGKSVPKTQMQFILSIVKEVEGQDVAKKLDDAIWDWGKKLRVPGNALMAARRSWAERRKTEGVERGLKWRVRLWSRKPSRWHDHRGVLPGRGERPRVKRQDDEEMVKFQPLAVDQEPDEMSLQSNDGKQTDTHDGLSRETLD